MIRLFQSNNMTPLVDAFVAAGDAAPLDPFQPMTVVVQSFGMGQWLKLRLAEATGIAANVECVLPANLIWQLYRQLLPLGLDDESPFAVERLTWHLMQLLPTCEGGDYAQVRQFLAGPSDAQVRAYQLAQKIGTLYDQYLVYRPDWILDWEDGRQTTPAIWQADLWRRLMSQPGLTGKQHRASLHHSLMARLAGTDPLPAAIPRHVSLFGLSSLPVIHLEALRMLSRHIDVDLYFLNPCQHYWGDIVSEKDTARRSVKRLLDKTEPLAEDDYLTVGNPLLSSMGKQGREYLELLLDVDEIETFDAFEEPTGTSMLATVQRDILALTFGGEFGTNVAPEPQAVADDDISIQIHACHSKMREVEVLHDQLLRIIDVRPEIKPADIIVMSPDVAEYAPFIDAVFTRDRFYYSIADRALNQESAVLVAFSSLMSLPDMRITSTEVMDLLQVPAIASQFQLDEDDRVTLTWWIMESGIRWELDAESKQFRWQVPGENQNTWQFGLDRLLLGYAMSSTEGSFAGVLPLDIDAADGELLGKLCHIVELLAHHRAELAEARSAHAWRQSVLRLLEDFFSPTDQDELDLARVRELLIRLEAETEETGFDAPLTAKMVRYWLDEQLSDHGHGRGFISGGVTFATLVPMRSIPFKVVCLLGMNDGAYPREDRLPAFDLMEAATYRKGDRSRRNDDRYLFLEALLSATDYFYISYEGRRLKDNQERPPSALVSEFLDYLTRVFNTNPVTFHPLQPFSEEYYSDQYPNLVTWRMSWFSALENPAEEAAFIHQRLSDDPDLAANNLGQLAEFFYSPARYFLRNRLGVYFETQGLELKDTETFELDPLERYGLAQSALNALLHNTPIEDWRDRAMASGHLIGGDTGVAQLERELERATVVHDELLAYLTVPVAQHHKSLIVPGYDAPIDGMIDNLYGDTIVACRAGQLRKRQLMADWVRHLFANAAHGNIRTVLISANSKGQKAVTSTLRPVPVDEAMQLFAELVQHFNLGLSMPLRFLPETSFAFASTLVKRQDEQAALAAALTEWEKDTPGTEGQDLNYQRLFSFPGDFNAAFREASLGIYRPLLAGWEPLK